MAGTAGELMQLLDLPALEGDLARSLLHQHSQPPLFNLLVGAALKATPDPGCFRDLLAALYRGAGLAMVLGIFLLARLWGAGRVPATAAAALFALYPLAGRMEGHLAYDQLLPPLLLAIALGLAWHHRRGGTLPLLLVLAASAACVLTRAFFHPLLWGLPVAALAVAAARQRDRGSVPAVALAAALVLLLGAAPLVKNRLLFGWGVSSSFQGMNLFGLTAYIPPGEVRAAVEEGDIPPVALLPRFSDAETYLAHYGPPRERGIPVLDQARRAGGHVNWNHAVFLAASRDYQRAALPLLLSHPREAAMALANGAYLFFGQYPNHFLWPVPATLWGAFPRVTGWRVAVEGPADLLTEVLIPAGTLLLCLALLLRWWRDRDDPSRLFAAGALAYIFLLSTFGELGENVRFRFQLDPLLFAGAALLGERLLGPLLRPFLRRCAGSAPAGGHAP